MRGVKVDLEEIKKQILEAYMKDSNNRIDMFKRYAFPLMDPWNTGGYPPKEIKEVDKKDAKL